MTRSRRTLLGVLALLTVLLAAGGYWLWGNLDGIVKRAIGRYGSQMTQATVSVEAVELRGTDGAGVVRGLVIGNPAGFSTPYALKVSVIEVAVELSTIADPVVHVQRILIDAPEVIYEMGDRQTNFDAIQRNIERSLVDGAAGAGASPASPGKKLIVDELIIRRARAHAAAPALLGRTVSATLPDVVLRNVGRREGGITPAQLGERVARVLSQRLAASLGFERVLKSLGDRVRGALGH